MCKVYNTIGSLTTLKDHLYRQNIYDFKSVKEVLEFQKLYVIHRQQVISHHKDLIEQEKNKLQLDIQQLDTTIDSQKLQLEQELSDEIDKLRQRFDTSTDTISKSYIHKFAKYLQQQYYGNKIHAEETLLNIKYQKAIQKLTDLYERKKYRYQYILSHFDDAVRHSYSEALMELERKKAIIDGLNSFIYGALGEHKVVKTLESLSDDYFLINDFSISFSSPIYNRQEDDYIISIQIDHVLIAPSGIFLIETKNWSEKSLENFSLRSPVEQIKRTSFAMFKLFNHERIHHFLHLDAHHWGNKKIPMKNLIILMNTKPKEEFQFVKILTLNELVSYVQYFKPIFTAIETQKIADYLLNINNKEIPKP
ncbi:MAG: NERD domain-containing protein [Saprospiraceae bacterium]|nr:NERD domain-containing protein [Saprospiraceae bacterium]